MKKRRESSHLEKVLNVWAIVLIIWSVYRAKFLTELPLWTDEFIAKPIVFILPVYIFIKKVEKTEFLQALDLKLHKSGKELLVGIALGLLVLASVILGYLRQTNLSLNALLGNVNYLYLLSISMATGISEEILSRGFVLKRLYEASKNMISASFFASVLFFFLHIPILFTTSDIGGFMLVRVMFADVVFSFLVSFIFIQRRSLIAPILIHAFYIFSLLILI